jgi:hypothetical protein
MNTGKTDQEVESEIQEAIIEENDVSNENKWITICYWVCILAVIYMVWNIVDYYCQ